MSSPLGSRARSSARPTRRHLLSEAKTVCRGCFAGPFHVAMLGAFLAAAGTWTLFLKKPIGVLLIAAGLALLLLAKVRTGIIALIIALLLLAALAFFFRSAADSSPLKALKPTGVQGALGILAVVVGLAGVGVIASQNVAVQRIADLPQDQRADSRWTAITDSLELTGESPITGWGPGASASGLKFDFRDQGKEQATPHNGALGLTVEAGVGALACFLLIAGSAALGLFREIARRKQVWASGVATSAVAPIAVFWILGDGLAALPISMCLSMIVGVFIANGLTDHDELPVPT